MVNRLDRKKCLVMMLFDATFSRGIRRQSQMKKTKSEIWFETGCIDYKKGNALGH